MGPVMFVSLVLAAASPAPIATPLAAGSPSAPVAASTTATPAATWLGITLGESSSQLRTQMGKPLEIAPTNVGDLWRYEYDSGSVTLEIVVNHDQVVNVAARLKSGKRSSMTDPFGVRLGSSSAALRTARGMPIATYDDGARLAYGAVAGVRWFYSIDGDAVSAIEVSQPLTATPPPGPQLIVDAVHDGSSIGRAIIVNASTDEDAVAAEYAYLRGLQCSGGGQWQIGGQRLIVQGNREYDQLSVVCSTTHESRDFYFDDTAGFGK